MKGIKTRWAQWQIDYLIAHFADTKNDELSEKLGVHWRTMKRKAKMLGLRKSAEFMRQTQRHAAECAAIANEGEGNRGAINLLIYGKPYQFKKGHPPLTGEKEAERLRKVHAKRNETIRKDYMRLRWGLEPKTKLVKHLPKNKRL